MFKELTPDDQTAAPIAKRTARTAQSLRNMLFDEIDSLRAGKSDIHRAKAVASLAAQIIGAARLEIDHAKSLKDYPELDKRKPLLLGSTAVA